MLKAKPLLNMLVDSLSNIAVLSIISCALMADSTCQTGNTGNIQTYYTTIIKEINVKSTQKQNGDRLVCMHTVTERRPHKSMK